MSLWLALISIKGTENILGLNGYLVLLIYLVLIVVLVLILFRHTMTIKGKLDKMKNIAYVHRPMVEKKQKKNRNIKSTSKNF